MDATRFTARLLGLVLGAGSVVSVHAESVAYAGTMETYPIKRVMALGNGDSVVSGTADGVATIANAGGGTPMLLTVLCTGMGLLGETSPKYLDFYCTFIVDDEHSFDVHGREDGSGFKAEIIGGSGRWNGAAGSAAFERVSVTDYSAHTNFKLDISTP